MAEAREARIDTPGITYRFGALIGAGGGPGDAAAEAAAKHAAEAFARLAESGETPGMDESVDWLRVNETDQNREALSRALAWAEEARRADVLLSIGIGGSYLGNRVLHDALLGPGGSARQEGVPELRFAGQHLDPLELRALVAELRGRASQSGGLDVRLLAISKSGTTTETLATTLALQQALSATPGVRLSLAALTAPTSKLAALCQQANGDVLPFPEGIGGRFSVLSPVGLVTAAATGVDVEALQQGARAVRSALLEAGGDLAKNPALLYASLHHAQARAGRMGAVFMPYSERLRSVSEWYVQLLAESLGKAKDRQGREVHAGRTPIVAVGTTDMHAQTQLHQEGPHDKTVTTVDVADWGPVTVDRVPEVEAAGKLAGKTFAELNTLARVANEEALASDGRPSDALILDRIDARTLGGLLYFLMASVAYEGELMDVCAYDQPGVEAYKKIMRERL